MSCCMPFQAHWRVCQWSNTLIMKIPKIHVVKKRTGRARGKQCREIFKIGCRKYEETNSVKLSLFIAIHMRASVFKLITPLVHFRTLIYGVEMIGFFVSLPCYSRIITHSVSSEKHAPNLNGLSKFFPKIFRGRNAGECALFHNAPPDPRLYTEGILRIFHPPGENAPFTLRRSSGSNTLASVTSAV